MRGVRHTVIGRGQKVGEAGSCLILGAQAQTQAMRELLVAYYVGY
jgi:hypothetical protein